MGAVRSMDPGGMPDGVAGAAVACCGPEVHRSRSGLTSGSESRVTVDAGAPRTETCRRYPRACVAAMPMMRHVGM